MKKSSVPIYITTAIGLLLLLLILLLIYSHSIKQTKTISVANPSPTPLEIIRVKGTLVDSKLIPVAGITIMIGPDGSTTDSEGHYQISTARQPRLHINILDLTKNIRYQVSGTDEQYIDPPSTGRNINQDFVIEPVK